MSENVLIVGIAANAFFSALNLVLWYGLRHKRSLYGGILNAFVCVLLILTLLFAPNVQR